MASRSPTLTLVAVFVAVYLVEFLVGIFGVSKSAFALATPVTLRPWTLVTSVYAHGSVGHLLANSVGLVLAGNRISDTVLSAVPLSGRAQLTLFVVVAVALTLLTASRGVALVAHFTGLLLGLLAGRAHLLRA